MSRNIAMSSPFHPPRPWLRRTGLALGLLAAATAAATTITPSLAGELPAFNTLVEQYGSAVVNIRASGVSETSPASELPEGMPEPFRRFFKELPEPGERPKGMQPQAQGSGFIISPDGYILTNAHVVKDAKEVSVRLDDRREYPAKVVGSDDRTDVALLKVEATNLPAVKVGDSDKLKVGDWVLAIGSPFGLDRTATQGIVSALSRSLPDENYVPFIQTDAAVNPGNSGGPLFDTDGKVVGVNSQIYSRSGGYMGVSFAIPINVAMNTAEQLKTKGHVERGWLGVTIQDMDQKLAQSFGLDKPEGALVSSVNPGSPADRAGIKAGDVILHYNGKSIDRSGNLPPLVGATALGSSVPVEVLRDGKTRQLTVTIAELAETPTQLAQTHGPAEKGTLGVMVSDLNAQQRQALGLSEQGVLVNGLAPDSPAASAGLQPNDVILAFDHQAVKSVAQMKDLVKKAPTGKPIALLVQRDQSTLFLPVLIPSKDMG